MLNFGFTEMLVIVVLAIVVVGPERLPAMMRFLGRQYGKLMRASEELRRAFLVEAEKVEAERRAEELRKRREEARKRAEEARSRNVNRNAIEATPRAAGPGEPVVADPAAVPPGEPAPAAEPPGATDAAQAALDAALEESARRGA